MKYKKKKHQQFDNYVYFDVLQHNFIKMYIKDQ